MSKKRITELYESNTGLVYSIFNQKFAGFRQFEEDLIQEGCIGLWNACNTFSTSKGVAFSTYACECIMNHMKMYLRKEIRHQERMTSLDLVGENNQQDIKAEDLIQKAENERLILITLEIAKTMGCDDIIRMKLMGETQREIAKKLNLSEARISEKVRNVYEKVREKELDI